MKIIDDARRARDISIYVHVPYCASKCSYCDFASLEEPAPPADRYLSALLSELKTLTPPGGERPTVSTLYIGGGTPSLLPPEDLMGLLTGIYEYMGLSEVTEAGDGVEVTLEANPGSLTKEGLAAYREAGVNRLSIGTQSLDDSVLKTLGRTHSADDVLRAFFDAREAGYENISVDLIYGVPGQDLKIWKDTLEGVIALSPEHVSAYCLTLSADSPMGRTVKEGGLTLPPEETVIEMSDLCIKQLKKAGLKRYEVSNFARSGLESRHNTRCWRRLDYIGLGAGAHSFIASGGMGYGIRWWNEPDPERYMEMVEDAGSGPAGLEELTLEQASLEALMLGLRRVRGVDIERFEKTFGVPPLSLLTNKTLVEDGLLVVGSGRLKATEMGLLFLNELV